VASVDKAKEIGINWWQEDAFLSSSAHESELKEENKKLLERIEKLEANSKS